MLKVATPLIVEGVEQHEMSIDGITLIELLAERCNSAPSLPSYEPSKKNKFKGNHELNIMYLE